MKYKILIILLFCCYAFVYGQMENWEVIGKMPIPVYGAEAVAVDTSILIIGGYSDSLKADVNLIQSYNPYRNTWTIVSRMNEGRSGLFAGIYNESVMIYGGITQPDSSSRTLLFFSAGWTGPNFLVDSILDINRIYSAGIIYNNSLFIIGGYPVIDGTVNSDTAYIIEYDLNSNKIKNRGIAQYASNLGFFPSEQMAVFYNDMIYVFGGSYNGVSKRIYTYSFVNDSITRSKEELPVPRAGGKAILYQGSELYLIGGYNEMEGALSSIEKIYLNGEAMYYVPMPSLNFGRKNLMAALFNDNIYVFGGTDSVDNVVPDIEKISVASNTTVVQGNSIPDKFTLSQNYPNPFNSSTKLSFSNSSPQFTSLNIFNSLGEKIKTLVDKQIISGIKTITWDGRDENDIPVPSGIYLYQLSSGDNHISKKMVLLK